MKKRLFFLARWQYLCYFFVPFPVSTRSVKCLQTANKLQTLTLPLFLCPFPLSLYNSHLLYPSPHSHRATPNRRGRGGRWHSHGCPIIRRLVMYPPLWVEGPFELARESILQSTALQCAVCVCVCVCVCG